MRPSKPSKPRKPIRPSKPIKPRYKPNKRTRALLADRPFLPPGDISRRNRAMVTMLPWKLRLLADLPRMYRDAIAVHHRDKRPTDEQMIYNLGHKLIGICRVPMLVLCNQIMNDPDRRADFESIYEYNHFFCDPNIEGKSVIDRRTTWPIVLSGRGRDRETIVDGWHRFHSYFRLGVRSVPVIWYADE